MGAIADRSAGQRAHGIYRMESEVGWIRELAMTPGDYFVPSFIPPANDRSPYPLELPRASGKH
jgi:hypothetical protein